MTVRHAGPGNRPSTPAQSRRSWAWLTVAATLVIAWLLPLGLHAPAQLQILMVAFLNASLAVGLAISLGYAGLLNLSHGTFYGFGAYATAFFVVERGWNLGIAMVAAAVIGALGALLLGFASGRVSGDFFALVSLAFTVASVEVMSNWTAVTRGREGFYGIPTQSVLGVRVDSFETAYWAGLGLLTFSLLAAWRFVAGSIGRALLAIRHDEVAAQAMGINVLYTRQLAMAMSGALAGVAGSVLVITTLFIVPNDFDLISSFNIGLWVIVGGMASLPGVAVAATGITMATEHLRVISDFSLGIIGLIVIATVMIRGGVAADVLHRLGERQRSWGRRRG